MATALTTPRLALLNEGRIKSLAPSVKGLDFWYRGYSSAGAGNEGRSLSAA